jgi:hypothetical protein
MSLKLDDMYLASVQVIESDFFSPQMSSFSGDATEKFQAM